MRPRTRDYQQMAIAILAIATAAIGIGLWAQSFDGSLPKSENPWLEVLYWVQVPSVFAATLLYFVTFASVARILGRNGNVTGKDLVQGPVVWLWMQMGFLALLFLAEFLSGLIAALGSAKPPM